MITGLNATFAELLHIQEIKTLPKDTKQTAKSRPFKGYLNHYLTKDEMSYVKGKPFTDEDFAAAIVRLSDSGYRLTLSPDEFNGCFQAQLTPSTTESSMAGYYLSGRGTDVIKAFKQLLYIHYEVCEGDWGILIDKQQRWRDIDD